MNTAPGFDKEFSFIAQLVYMEAVTVNLLLPKVLSLQVIRCNSEISGEEAANVIKIEGHNLNDFYCIDYMSIPEEMRKIAKTIGTKGSFFLRAYIKQCDTEKIEGCGWAFKKYGDLVLMVSVIDKFTDISNFENPINKQFKSFSVHLSSSSESIVKYLVSSTTLLSDEGLVFSSVIEQKFLSFEKEEANIFPKSPITKNVASIGFEAFTREGFIERQYIKVQELLANIAGFVKGLVAVCKLLNFLDSDVSFINQINEIKNNHKLNRVKVNIIQSANISQEKIIQSSEKLAPRVTVLQYFKNLLCCKLKINSDMKSKALKALDLQDILNQKAKVEVVEKKLKLVQVDNFIEN